MQNELVTTIGKTLNIQQPQQNQKLEWICQVIYSVAGKMALASLWDHDEISDSISLQHFKKRICRIYDAYIAAFPQVKGFHSQDVSNIADEIYTIYLRTGHFYHSAHRISPAYSTTAGENGILVHRGISPDNLFYMSGLGFYSLSKTNSTMEMMPASQMFDLQTQSFEDYLQELIDAGEWEKAEWQDNTEFLILAPPFSKSYWKNSPDKNTTLSLARFGEHSKIFAFYRYENGVFYQKIIPEWRIRDFREKELSYGEYRRIAIAILRQKGNLPPIRAKKSGPMYEISVGYRLPPTEEDFFMLYSWPTRYEISPKMPQVFRRKMACDFYPLFKKQLERIGYTFLEE